MAEPEADAQYRPLVRHWNGAVTPVDTYSVQAARAAHLTAKANAYNFRPYTYAAYPYTYAVPAVKPLTLKSEVVATGAAVPVSVGGYKAVAGDNGDLKVGLIFFFEYL